MAVPTVTVSVDVHESDGTPIVGAIVTARLTGVDVYQDQIVDRVTEQAVTAADGSATLALFPNALGERGTAYFFKIVHPTTGRSIFKTVAEVPNQNCQLTDIAGNVSAIAQPGEPSIGVLVGPGLIIKNSAQQYALRSVIGTANQVTVLNGDGELGNITLSLPQNIHAGAAPTFAGLTIAGDAAVSGLVDGYDVSVLGAKLAGLPTSAIQDVALNAATSSPPRGRINFQSNAVLIADDAGSNSKVVILPGMIMQAFASAFAPADATTYFFGANSSVPTTVAGLVRVPVPKTGHVRRIELHVGVAGTLGSSESMTISFRLNDTTDTLISNAAKADALSQSYGVAVDIAVVLGDFYQIKVLTPTWVTNPTNVLFSVSLYLD